jgi:hypothetical protein
MSAIIREINVTWCPSCGKAYDVPVDRIMPAARPTRREMPLECSRCGCRQLIFRGRPRLRRPLNNGAGKNIKI